MRRLAMTAALMCLPGGWVCGQQAKPSAAIPATAPTSVSDLPSARPAATVASTTRGQSRVTWADGALTVAGNGDSLRNILSKVARQTGMKVTGGVPEEPVFASYGPAPLQTVIAELFDGISVNMVLTDKAGEKNLVLTARTGGVTPPQARPLSDEEQGRGAGGRPGAYEPPRPFGSEARGNDRPAGAPPPGPGQGQPGALPPVASPDVPAGTATPATDAPAAAATDSTGTTDSTGQQQSPNGVRTPEQIFEELRKRQQSTPQ